MVEKKRISFIIKSFETLEGAGVKVRRAFGDPNLAYLTDPFLLLDDFGSRYPHEYLAGFPWHPHRGFETVTYVIKGEVHHEDSTGLKGIINSGDIQWMTAGSGIFHSEMPKPMKIKQGNKEIEDPEHRGLQLWINLPSRLKMTTPLYRNLRSKYIPKATLDNGIEVKLIAGEIKNIPGLGTLTGPVSNASVYSQDVSYIEFIIPPQTILEYPVKKGYTTLAYVIEGEILGLKENKEIIVKEKNTILFDKEGEKVFLRTGEKQARIILLTGRPIEEPIAWYGPIVMNTEDELIQAFRELREGKFIKHKATEIDDITS
jgi:redox-sensitive bicupin YhaK (pirin superfamily)